MSDQVLVITRGLPASGKSTLAREWVAEDPENRSRVNRDDLRSSLFGGEGVLAFEHEGAVSRVQKYTVRNLLNLGRSVIVDDTNLRLKFAREWAQLAHDAEVAFEVKDVLTSVDECVRRDRERAARGERFVGEEAIRDIDRRFRDRPAVTLPVVVDPVVAPYVPDPKLPAAWLVDIDGTLAHMNGRGPFEWNRVGEDLPSDAVVSAVRALASIGRTIVVMSGRDGVCRPETEGWLAEHGVPFDELHMRAEGDSRRDSIVKSELFDTHIRDRFRVIGVLDDREQVVRMWRDQLGLVCFQVADGDF